MDLSLNERAAVVRTRLALERTLMAWQRTAVSLIAFGFTFYKATQFFLQQEHPPRAPGATARTASMLLILTGLLSLVLAQIQHVRHVKTIREIDPELQPLSIALVVSILFTLFGFTAMLIVFFEF